MEEENEKVQKDLNINNNEENNTSFSNNNIFSSVPLEMKEDNDYIFHEISAKTGEGFSDLFYKSLFERIRTKFRPQGQQPASEVKDIKFNINQEAKKNESKKGCC